MAPPERRSHPNKTMIEPLPIEEPLEAEDEMDTGEITYFVDEEGRYYYQPTQSLVDLPTGEEDAIEQEPLQEEEPGQEGEGVAGEESYQTVTLVPSKNSNGEVSYVLETQHPALVEINNIKQEDKVDVYEFVVEEEEDEGQEAPPAGAEPQSAKKKRKGKGKGARAIHACLFCSYSSHRRYLLFSHMKCHSEERPFKCKVCDRSIKTQASLQNHTNMHNGVKPHVCKSCEATFTTSGDLVRHVRYKHTLERPHKCTECDYATVERSKLRRHVRCHTGERPYQCTDCTYASADTFKLKRHRRTHTGERPYKCDLCNLRFTQSNSLKSHRLIHNGNKPVFACELCPAQCGRKADLRTHVQTQHTSVQPLKCKWCGKSFPDRYSYRMHNKTHASERCYKCNLCPYTSTTPRSLKWHLLKHTDEKPFACDDCNQTFRQKQLLRRHQNLYHNPQYVKKPPMEKTHTCHECERTFAHKGNLIRHLAVHEPASVHHETALALKQGRQKRVKYVESDTLKELQEEAMGETQTLKLGISSKLGRGEVVAAEECAGQQYVVLEVIQLEDGSEQQVPVVSPDFCALRSQEGDSVMIEAEAAEDQEEIDGEEQSNEIEMPQVEEEKLEEEEMEIEEEEDNIESILLKHSEIQEIAAAERSIKLEQEIDTCFGFGEDHEEEEEDGHEFTQSIIYQFGYM